MNNFSTTKITVPIKNVLPNPWNPNVQSDDIFEKEKKSIEEMGMLGSILVRETAGVYEILDGEHRWKACKELGYTEIPVETIGEIPDNQAKTLTILLNNLRGKDDVLKRAEILKSLDEGQLQLLPFSEEEVENEKKLLDFDFSQYDEQEPVKDRQMLINVPVSEEEYKVWQTCVDLANKEEITPTQLIMRAAEDFLALRKGASADQRTQEI